MVEVAAKSIRFSPAAQNRFLLLQEIAGPRCLPIWVDAYGAQVIAMLYQGVASPQPLPHDLLVEATRVLGGSADRVATRKSRPQRRSIPGELYQLPGRIREIYSLSSAIGRAIAAAFDRDTTPFPVARYLEIVCQVERRDGCPDLPRIPTICAYVGSRIR